MSESDELKSVIIRICNRAHLCVNAKNCKHAKPHEGNCGPSMPCYDDPSGEISCCVEVENGKFKTHHRDWCKHCGGKGYHEQTKIHDA
jgi:hypothetical protein